MIWQLYSACQLLETHIVSAFALSHISTIYYIHIIQLKTGRSMVVGHVLMVHASSFMCTNHIDMIAHTPAFFMSCGALLSSGLPSCKQRMAGNFFLELFSEIVLVEDDTSVTFPLPVVMV